MKLAINDDSAVSETLGYILIFTIVVTSIAFIVYAGNGVLDTSKAQNNFKSMEQGFTVLSSDLKQVALEGAPVMTTRIHMEGGTISANEDSNGIVITFDGGPVYNDKTGDITFNMGSGAGIVSIENGGLWEKQGVANGDIVVLKPRIYTVPYSETTDTLVLNVIKLDAAPASIGGSKTMDIALSDGGTTVYTPPEKQNGADVVISFDTNYPNAWVRFFQGAGATVVSQDDDSFTVKFTNISKLIVSEHTVGVSVG